MLLRNAYRMLTYIALLISANCYGADSSLECFDRFANFDLPFEIYAEDSWPICKKFIQPLESNYGLSTKGVPFIECADEATVAPLRSGNFLAAGKPLTNILMGPEIQSLEGYKKLLEQYVREEASLHELLLRKFKKKSKDRDMAQRLAQHFGIKWNYIREDS